jgi:hypothetical protein
MAVRFTTRGLLILTATVAVAMIAVRWGIVFGKSIARAQKDPVATWREIAIVIALLAVVYFLRDETDETV